MTRLLTAALDIAIAALTAARTSLQRRPDIDDALPGSSGHNADRQGWFLGPNSRDDVDGSGEDPLGLIAARGIYETLTGRTD